MASEFKRPRLDSPNEYVQEISRLRTALDEAESEVFHQRCRLHEQEDIINVAEGRVEMLEMELIDLRESNDNYATIVQRQAVQHRNDARLLEALRDELLEGIEAHGREINRLVEASTAASSAQHIDMRTVGCPVCSEDTPEIYHVLPCCNHALCASCSAACGHRCPFCRASDRRQRATFRRWW